MDQERAQVDTGEATGEFWSMSATSLTDKFMTLLGYRLTSGVNHL